MPEPKHDETGCPICPHCDKKTNRAYGRYPQLTCWSCGKKMWDHFEMVAWLWKQNDELKSHGQEDSVPCSDCGQMKCICYERLTPSES